MDIFEQALLIDAIVVPTCLVALLRYGNLTFSHPAISYMVFHVYVVTLRLLALAYGGGTTLFSTWRGAFDPVLPEEIARAAGYFDIALVTMTLTWLWLRWRKPSRQPVASTPLSPKIVWTVIVVSFLIGLAGIAIGAQLPGVEAGRTVNLGEWGSSSYVAITQTWCGLALLAYIYCYGFRRVPVVLLGIYLLVMIFQGYHRFRVVIPVLMLAQIWLDRRRLRWPPKWMVIGFVALVVGFFPLKNIGRMWQTGASLSDIGDVVSQSTARVVAGENEDQMFLDQCASALTLVDINGQKYWGSMYAALLTLPVPRQWWPDKPSVADFLRDISIPSRPMKEAGMIVTFIGEAYANCGLVGIFLVPPLLAAFLTGLYRRAYSADYNTVIRFGYVLICVNLMQVYRDGLTSLVMFAFVNTLPLMMIVLLHFAVRVRPVAQFLARPATRPTS